MTSGDGTVKKVLMIARAFPPFNSAGHSIRVVKFLKYLPSLGWRPYILTVDDRKEYEFDRKQASASLLAEIPGDVRIHRTRSGELSLGYLQKERAFGQHSRLLEIIVKVWAGARRWVSRHLLVPDRSIVWLPFALLGGRQIMRAEQIDVIFVTCPPYSATLVGALLKVLTAKPFVLDFRDDWIDTPWYHSKSAVARLIHRHMERWVVRKADKVVLVTEWSRKAFTERYPAEPARKFVLVPNGCDLEDFLLKAQPHPAPGNATFTIVHAGAMNDTEPWRRNPAGLFQAVQNLLRRNLELSEKLTLVFAGGLPEAHRRLADEMGLSAVVKVTGHLPHNEVLRLIRAADLLLAINYENWPTIIPAKIYEYWAVGGPPILLLSCPGAAADVVERHRLGLTVDHSDSAGIERAILAVYRQREAGAPMRVSTDGIHAYDRQALTRELAQVFAMITQGESLQGGSTASAAVPSEHQPLLHKDEASGS